MLLVGTRRTAAKGGALAEAGAIAAARHLEPALAALRAGSGARAIHLVRQVLAARALADDDTLLPVVRAAAGDAEAARLIRAFAEARCMYCRGGLDPCDGCGGTGRSDHRAAACPTCAGVGAVRCQFCGGSGLDSYEAMPAGLLMAVGTCRVDAAAARAAQAAAHPPPAKVTAEQLPAVRRALAQRAVDRARDLAVLVNAAQMARALRGRGRVESRHATGRLFGRAAGAAQSARRQLACLYRRLASASAHMADLSPDALTRQFEEDRSALMAEEAARLLLASRRRTTLLPGR